MANDWEFTYRGLTIGGETAYNISKVEGLFDLPDVTSSSRKRTGSHGFITGRQLAGKRTGTIDIAYGSDTSEAGDVFDARDALLAAFHPLDYEEPMVFGVPDRPARQLYCRVTRLHAPVGFSWVVGFAESMRLEVVAEDFPFWQSEEAHAASAGSQTPSGGRGYPLVYPRLYGPLALGSQMPTPNAGNADACWEADIFGPCVNPAIVLNSTAGAQTVKVETTLNAGEYIHLDRRQELILVQGNIPRFDILAAGSAWFDIPPGESHVHYVSDDLQGSATITWHDTWW